VVDRVMTVFTRPGVVALPRHPMTVTTLTRRLGVDQAYLRATTMKLGHLTIQNYLQTHHLPGMKLVMETS